MQNPVREALAELVRLKGLKERIESDYVELQQNATDPQAVREHHSRVAEYARCKGPAWESARAALALPAPPFRLPWTPEEVASRFHDAYEQLAPHFGYKTRDASAVPWGQVPEQNRALMIATVRNVLIEQLSAALYAEPPAPREQPTEQMIAAGRQAWLKFNEEIGLDSKQTSVTAVYAAMVAAAPSEIARDAARYRWLRDGPLDRDGLHRADVIYMQHHHGPELDAAIDAAIEQERNA
jgi:hypothetical protein